jgi:hypothetical protein
VSAGSVAALYDIHGNPPALDVGRVFPDADPDEVAQDYERASAKPVPAASLIAPADNPLAAERARSAG